MKIRYSPIHYYDECWQCNFWLMIGWPEDYFRDYMINFYDYTPKTWDKNAKTIHLEMSNDEAIIIWTRKKHGKRFYCDLSHESVHAAIFCLDARGVPINSQNDEAIAYLSSAIMRHGLR